MWKHYLPVPKFVVEDKRFKEMILFSGCGCRYITLYMSQINTHVGSKAAIFPQVTPAVITQRRLLAGVSKSTRIPMCEGGDVNRVGVPRQSNCLFIEDIVSTRDYKPPKTKQRKQTSHGLNELWILTFSGGHSSDRFPFLLKINDIMCVYLSVFTI